MKKLKEEMKIIRKMLKNKIKYFKILKIIMMKKKMKRKN